MCAAANYPDTYYAFDIGDIPQRPELTEKIGTDICVIGGGLAGLTTALELLRKGKSVVVLESMRVGFGASGRNGGAVLGGFAQGDAEIAKRVGTKKAAALDELALQGVHYIRAQIDNLGLKDVITGEGRLSVVRHGKTASAKAKAESGAGEFLNTAAIQESLVSKKYNHAIRLAAGFHIQPLRYVLGLAAEIERLGGQIFEASKATELTALHPEWQVTTAKGQVSANHVVLCTSGYDFSLWPNVSNAIQPVATYVMATEPMAEKLDTAIKTEAVISDTRRAGDYYRRLKNGRLLWGGRITTQQGKPAKLAALLKRDVLSVYPQLGPIKLTHSWMGLMGYATDKMPLIGQPEKNLWMATAFGGHGLNTTAMAGCLIASAIADNDQQYKLFDSYQPRWAGGIFGRVGVQLTYWMLMLQDWWDERGQR